MSTGSSERKVTSTSSVSRHQASADILLTSSEDCADSHVPLPQHPYPFLPSRAAYLLDQMVSVVRDDLHAGRVCHRDLKGENILVNPDTGDILLLGMLNELRGTSS